MELIDENGFNPNKPIMTRYANKLVNNKFYEKITISGSGGTKEIPTLTREEFKEGKAGYVWMDNKTGEIKFKDE